MRLCFRIDRVASIEKVVGSTGLNTGVLSAAFQKYAYDSVRAEEARRAVSKPALSPVEPGLSLRQACPEPCRRAQCAA